MSGGFQIPTANDLRNSVVIGFYFAVEEGNLERAEELWEGFATEDSRWQKHVHEDRAHKHNDPEMQRQFHWSKMQSEFLSGYLFGRIAQKGELKMMEYLWDKAASLSNGKDIQREFIKDRNHFSFRVATLSGELSVMAKILDYSLDVGGSVLVKEVLESALQNPNEPGRAGRAVDLWIQEHVKNGGAEAVHDAWKSVPPAIQKFVPSRHQFDVTSKAHEASTSQSKGQIK